jgi:1,2-dihydroxy-3-keto-5-methylthiopentene dioxygenase
MQPMPQTTRYDTRGHALGQAAQACAAAQALSDLGILSGRWILHSQPVSSTPQLSYARELRALQSRFSAVMTDRVRQRPDLRGARRQKGREVAALSWPEPPHEHVHAEPEVRIVLDGRATFLVRDESGCGWLSISCEPGDWLALPAGLPHLLQVSRSEGVDMLRLYSQPGGWQAQPTGGVIPVAWPSGLVAARSAVREALAA